MADQLTLQTLSDDIQQLSLQVENFAVEVDSLSTIVDTHDTDITDLQNPPVGVPPALLSWLATPHSIREVDTTLDTDITTVEDGLVTVQSDITDIQTSIADEITNRTDGDTGLQTSIDDLQTQIDQVSADLTQEVNDRGDMGTAYATSVAIFNDRVDNIENDLNSEIASRTTDSTTIFSSIATLNSSMSVANQKLDLLSGTGVDPEGALAAQIIDLTTIANDAAADVAEEVIKRQDGDTALETSVNSLSLTVSGLNTQIESEKDTREAKDLEHDADISALQGSVASWDASLSAETSNRVSGDDALQVLFDSLDTAVADNTADISQEITDRTDADAIHTADIDALEVSVASNTTDITGNTNSINALKLKYGLTIDGFGYVTGYEDLGDIAPDANFWLRDVNNDVRISAPGYNKPFPAISVLSFALPVTYDTQYGVAANNDFKGTDTNNYTRAVNVYAPAGTGLTSSHFWGADYDVSGNTQRLGSATPTFKIKVSGGVNRYLSVWYRVKDDPGVTTGQWLPALLADNTISGSGTYGRIDKEVVIQIPVDVTKVIQFGVTVLNTLDATIASASDDNIYGGYVTIEAYNLVTVA